MFCSNGISWVIFYPDKNIKTKIYLDKDKKKNKFMFT